MGGVASRCRPRPYEKTGVVTERREKCAFSITENHLSRRGVGSTMMQACLFPAQIEASLRQSRKARCWELLVAAYTSDGRVPHRLGSGHEWPPRLWSVERSPSSLALQLPGDAGRVSGPLRAGPTGEGRGPPHSSVPVSPLCPREISLPTLPVLQGAAASSEPTPQSSARKRSGAGELATVASSAISCRSSITGHRTTSSNNTRGQSRETGSLSRLFGSVETTAKCICLGPAHCRARLSHSILIESILTAVVRVRKGRSLTVEHFQQLLGLMAAVCNVIPFGLLYMRPLQLWLRTKRFSQSGNSFHTSRSRGDTYVPWTCGGSLGSCLRARCWELLVAA
ncbi:Dual-specificity RNA methyltransferase RlmN [Labeo rohita]|uniref:Dual-specificity RNA methyltransferase RlmN n=1 Tax=Labeo rohita TaxID=84645 RepID=A0ABQ8MVV7_LABRO|nr:Dual-specificity RNA methyltransferase RlmN [Labeo rohita]